MCLAPKVRRFNSTTKAPIDLSRLKQKQQFIPPKSKSLKAKPAPNVEKKVELEAASIPRLAPRLDRPKALDAIFRDSFEVSPAGDFLLTPRMKRESMVECSEPPCIRRTFSFSSVSSQQTTPTSNVKHFGTIYLYADCRCEDEDLEEIKEAESFDECDTKPAAYDSGMATPPVTHATSSLSPPPSPRPVAHFVKDAFFPQQLWLPTFP